MKKLIVLTSALLASFLPSVAHADIAPPVSNTAASTGAVAVVFVVIWLLFVGLFSIVGILGLILWIFMIVDVVERDNWVNENDKTTWLLIVILIGWIGAIVYYFSVRKKLGPPKKAARDAKAAQLAQHTPAK